jgi:four helix bundle protein
MKSEELKTRTRQFALRIIRVFASLSRRDDVQQVVGRQLLRSGTSVGAQYREASRARSPAEFISKLTSAMQELDETGYWLEVLVESGTVPAKRLEALMKETDELLAIFFASIRTASRKT